MLLTNVLLGKSYRLLLCSHALVHEWTLFHTLWMHVQFTN